MLGLLGVGGYNTLAYIALQYTVATNAVLLNSFIPIATMAISWAVLGRSLARIQAIGSTISFCGVIIIIARGDASLFATLSINPGDLWMLAAVLIWAIYTVGLHWRPTGIHPMLLLAALIVVGLGALTPLYLWELLVQGRSINVNSGSLVSLLYVGVFPSFLGYIFYNRGVIAVGANKASLFFHLMPVFGTLLSYIFLGEVPLGFHFIGIGLILSGIFLTTRNAVK
jgi:drug/metabolite transporter (DMT)-like permease